MKEIKLLPFQETALSKISTDHCALYWEMGLGKTFAGSEMLMKYNSRYNLVICQKSKVTDWLDHFTTYYDVDVIDLTKAKNEQVFLDSTHAVGVLNYDILSRRPWLTKVKDLSIAYDESSLIKNNQAKRTKAAFKLKSDHNILLSGTPVGGRYEELWSQCKLLGWNITKGDFWDEYIIYENWIPIGTSFPIKRVLGYKNVENLKRKLAEYGAIFMKSEQVIELPEQTFNTIKIESIPEYKVFSKHRLVEIDGVTMVGDTPLLRLLYTRFLASQYNKNKIVAFNDLVNSTNDRLIVFYNFNDELAVFSKVCEHRPISKINGNTKDLTAYENHENSITFCQYQSAARGLNLQKANKIIYVSPPLSSDLFEQSKKRTHRMGQKNNCSYYHLVTKDSVEEHIYEVLAQRKDYTEKLFEEI